MTAILFGSIGSLADTSELQRQSFNEAFAEHGLDWSWSQSDYREMLAESGGRDRIAAYAKSHGADIDADAIHRTKSEIFQRHLREGTISARPGVAETIAAAERDGTPVALVTTTSPDNVAALVDALGGQVDLSRFALLLDTSHVDAAKPAPDAYRVALQRLDEDAGSCVAIEDNAGGVTAAHAAGVTVIAFPGENNADHDFGDADARADGALDPTEVIRLAEAA